MKKYNYAIFDLDGTLLDTSEGVIAAAVQAMKDYNKEIPDYNTLRSIIGPPMQVSFKNMFGLSDSVAMQMADLFRNYYKTDEFLLKAFPYEGIYDVFNLLKKSGINVGVATYKREDYAERLLCQKQFSEYTNFMFGSDFAGKLKKKDIIELCLKDMKCDDYSKAVYIGDSDSDGIAANSVGIDFIAVNYGFGFSTDADSKKYHPVGIATKCLDIESILLSPPHPTREKNPNDKPTE